ncbi:OsmC family protein [Colwelliaceae bacterium 6441]
MKAEVKWIDEEMFAGISESGHSLVLDANAGKLAPSPLENILISLGCCSSVDVISILKKTRQQVTDCKVEITGTRVDTVPKLFSDIHLHFIISGHDIAEKHVKKAVSLSADKYCSVALMLNKSVNITHDFSVIDL